MTIHERHTPCYHTYMLVQGRALKMLFSWRNSLAIRKHHREMSRYSHIALRSHVFVTHLFLQDILKVYDEIRRSRSQKVWDYAFRAGKVLSGYTQSKLTKEEFGKELTTALGCVNSYTVGEDVAEAQDQLTNTGIWV